MFYVGITRAKEILYITWRAAGYAPNSGEAFQQFPSIFLADLPPNSTEVHDLGLLIDF
jgi:superfamily I DNA/RNA helicase